MFIEEFLYFTLVFNNFINLICCNLFMSVYISTPHVAFSTKHLLFKYFILLPYLFFAFLFRYLSLLRVYQRKVEYSIRPLRKSSKKFRQLFRSLPLKLLRLLN